MVVRGDVSLKRWDVQRRRWGSVDVVVGVYGSEVQPHRVSERAWY